MRIDVFVANTEKILSILAVSNGYLYRIYIFKILKFLLENPTRTFRKLIR